MVASDEQGRRILWHSHGEDVHGSQNALAVLAIAAANLGVAKYVGELVVESLGTHAWCMFTYLQQHVYVRLYLCMYCKSKQKDMYLYVCIILYICIYMCRHICMYVHVVDFPYVKTCHHAKCIFMYVYRSIYIHMRRHM